MNSTGVRLASGSGAVALLLALTACGSARISDGASAEAQECKRAPAAAIDGAFQAASDAAGAATQAAFDSLLGQRPDECEKLAEELGAKLVSELQQEYPAKISVQGEELGKSLAGTPTPGPTPS